jgi:ribosomal protein S18 acetylase RimI-like enzyme
MLEYRSLTLENFHRYQADIIRSEEIFPPDIRETPETYREALGQENLLAFVVFSEGCYAGNVVGFSPGMSQQQALRLDEINVGAEGLIYLFNIVAMPEQQGRGLGRLMLDHFIQTARQVGCRRVGGHFRDNRSLKNFLLRGAEVLWVFEDWFGTGENYSYCELLLSPDQIDEFDESY